MDLAKGILSIFGLIAICGVVLFCGVMLVMWMNEMYEKLKLHHMQKHRFDKSPTAKCYCIDCKNWDKKTGRCYSFDRQYTADSWFCWKADPRTQEGGD